MPFDITKDFDEVRLIDECGVNDLIALVHLNIVREMKLY